MSGEDRASQVAVIDRGHDRKRQDYDVFTAGLKRRGAVGLGGGEAAVDPLGLAEPSPVAGRSCG
jgi:hypothetical protein